MIVWALLMNAGILGVVEEDALEDWSEVLGGTSQVFGFRSCSTHCSKADLFLESDRAGEKVMEGDQVVT